MARVKLKETMEGNRRNVDCNGRRLTVYKGAYQRIPDSYIEFFNQEQYDILTDGEPIIGKVEAKPKEIKIPVKTKEEKPSKKIKLKTK